MVIILKSDNPSIWNPYALLVIHVVLPLLCLIVFVCTLYLEICL